MRVIIPLLDPAGLACLGHAMLFWDVSGILAILQRLPVVSLHQAARSVGLDWQRWHRGMPKRKADCHATGKLLGLDKEPHIQANDQPLKIVEIVIETRDEKDKLDKIMTFDNFRSKLPKISGPENSDGN